MIKYFTLLLQIIIINTSFAQDYQQWVKTYNGAFNGDEATIGLAVDKFGNSYTTGFTSKPGPDIDIITIKYDTEGQLLWVRTYNGTANSTDGPAAIVVDDSGNVYVCGYSRGINSEADYITIKYDTDGNERWTARYNGPGNQNDFSYGICLDNSGNVIVTGSSIAPGTLTDYATIKYSPDGVEQWVVRYDGSYIHHDYAKAVVVDHSGNIYVSGLVYGGLNYEDYCTIKYNSSGVQQWVRNYDGSEPGSHDMMAAMKLDHNGNVYITGYTYNGPVQNIATIKYNPSGDLIWVKRNYGTANITNGRALAIDNNNNIIVTGTDYNGLTENTDCLTIKYDSNGNELWSQQYNSSPNKADVAYAVTSDSSENIFITGWSNSGSLSNTLTIKYNSSGTLEWVQNYNGSANSDDNSRCIAIDTSGNVYIGGHSSETGNAKDILTIKYINEIAVIKPKQADKWIAGNKYLIKWIKPGWSTINVKCILNYQTTSQKVYPILNNISSSITEYEWTVPDTLLSFNSRIVITNANDTTQSFQSKFFRIKPYVLTRLNADLTYYAYNKTKDQWGFSNTASDIWPASYTNQFNYRGIDPFTGSQYSQIQGNRVFAATTSITHPDWISFVNAFSVANCYLNVAQQIYSAAALTKWAAVGRNWGGSCFGIAATNALAFSKKSQFQSKFINFPAFINPISVVSDAGVKKAVNELFTHQFGKPSTVNDISGNLKTPYQTLNDIKQMLTDDNSSVKTLSIFNNGGSGAHTILAYGLKQDPVQKNLYYVKVYDNSFPNSNSTITIDTAANGGSGSWSTPDWAGWGGIKGIYLEVISDNYFNNINFKVSEQTQSPFILSESELTVNNAMNSSIRITDTQGRTTGYSNNTVLNEIPNSFPQMVKNGSAAPPYGYSLQTDNYSIVLNDFAEDTIETFFFTGNKSFAYERSNALQSQTDRLYFDGGVSAVNPDAQTKNIKLLNLINESSQEKLFVVSSLNLAQNDSVKIENPDSNKVKLISYGTAKNYDLELNYVTENGIGRFGDFDVPLEANTSHTFVPDWTDLTNTELQVLVDIGNDGIIDDTLSLVNQVTGIGEDQGSFLTPDSYNLAQNYPNPFNPTTKISWQSPISSHQTIKVYDLLGNEVATLVDEFREAGRYEIEFNASNLSSGIYFYRLQAGDFVQTRKMILLR